MPGGNCARGRPNCCWKRETTCLDGRNDCGQNYRHSHRKPSEVRAHSEDNLRIDIFVAFKRSVMFPDKSIKDFEALGLSLDLQPFLTK